MQENKSQGFSVNHYHFERILRCVIQIELCGQVLCIPLTGYKNHEHKIYSKQVVQLIHPKPLTQ